MDIQLLDTSNAQWKNALSRLRHDIYQMPEYLQLEATRNGAVAEAVLIQDGECLMLIPYLRRECNPLVPTAQLGQPIYDIISPYGYPGLLVNQAARQTPKFADNALAAVVENLRSRQICSAFLRLHPILNDTCPELFAADTLTENGETISVDLRVDDLWSAMKGSHRNKVNRCRRAGMTAKMVPFTEYVDTFVAIYQETMDRVSASTGYYEFDRAYFQQMYQLMAEQSYICVVEYEGEVASAGVYTESGGIIQSVFGGTRDQFVRMSPSTFEIYQASVWAKERGNEFLHLGGGLGGSKDDSVYAFKAGFSKLRHPFYTMRLIIEPDNYALLTQLRAQQLGQPITKLADTEFFPSYRAA